MIIFPAIDIQNGKCVRLIKGNFDKITIFNNSPVDQALFFKEKGFSHLHLVDLDGALNDSTINQKIIKKIIKNTKQKIQLGGGIKKIDQISKWLDAGVDKVVLGTMAVIDEKNFEKACTKFQSKIVVAVDVLNDFLYFQGWKNKSKIKVLNFLKKIEDFKISRIIYTNIAKDGLKKGIDRLGSKRIIKNTDIPVVISGGVSSLEDVKIAKNLGSSGLIIGRAIYDKVIDIDKLFKII